MTASWTERVLLAARCINNIMASPCSKISELNGLLPFWVKMLFVGKAAQRPMLLCCEGTLTRASCAALYWRTSSGLEPRYIRIACTVRVLQ